MYMTGTVKNSLVRLLTLVVEDAPDNRVLITRILQRAGAEVEIAENGREGVDRALKGDHDAVIMDIQMPVMDGNEATRLLRKQGYKKPIIALTAHATQDDRDRFLADGFNELLTKPLDIALLLQTLSRFAAPC